MQLFICAAAVYLALVNLAAFAAFGLDKYYAIKNRWRISERRLFLLAFLGGAAGALLGMFVFHHKIRKARFTIGIPLILAIYCLLGLLLLGRVS